MTQIKLLLLNKDGTLTTPKSGKEFVQSPEDQKLLPGVENAIASYAADGWQMAIVSNQAGVEAGHKTMEGEIAEMEFCLKLLPQISRVYFCPTFNGDRCVRFDGHEWKTLNGGKSQIFRKPSAGMIFQAMGDLIVSNYSGFPRVLLVGDMPTDEEAALNAGIHFLSAANWRS